MMVQILCASNYSTLNTHKRDTHTVCHSYEIPHILIEIKAKREVNTNTKCVCMVEFRAFFEMLKTIEYAHTNTHAHDDIYVHKCSHPLRRLQ